MQTYFANDRETSDETAHELVAKTSREQRSAQQFGDALTVAEVLMPGCVNHLSPHSQRVWNEQTQHATARPDRRSLEESQLNTPLNRSDQLPERKGFASEHSVTARAGARRLNGGLSFQCQ